MLSRKGFVNSRSMVLFIVGAAWTSGLWAASAGAQSLVEVISGDNAEAVRRLIRAGAGFFGDVCDGAESTPVQDRF